MRYEISFKPRALKDLESLDYREQSRILRKIEMLMDSLQGDVKHLTHYTPEYRLRIGEYRVLFEIDKNDIIIYRIKHRRDAYQ